MPVTFFINYHTSSQSHACHILYQWKRSQLFVILLLRFKFCMEIKLSSSCVYGTLRPTPGTQRPAGRRITQPNLPKPSIWPTGGGAWQKWLNISRWFWHSYYSFSLAELFTNPFFEYTCDSSWFAHCDAFLYLINSLFYYNSFFYFFLYFSQSPHLALLWDVMARSPLRTARPFGPFLFIVTNPHDSKTASF